MASLALVGIGDHIVDGVVYAGWVYPMHHRGIGGYVERSLGLPVVPNIRQADPACLGVYQQAWLDDPPLAAGAGARVRESLGENGAGGEVEGIGAVVSRRSPRRHPDKPVLSGVVGK